jgi:hypothetical protein
MNVPDHPAREIPPPKGSPLQVWASSTSSAAVWKALKPRDLAETLTGSVSTH